MVRTARILLLNSVQMWNFRYLKVLDEKGSAPISRLLDALDWCTANKVRLLHMSLGTRNYFDVKELEGRIARLTKGGTIIVAAYHNSNMRTYPAVFSRVFGVRQDMSGIFGQGELLFQKIKGLEEENSIVIHWWKRKPGLCEQLCGSGADWDDCGLSEPVSG